MIRNIKALGLAVVAMLAMSALVASAAQAEPITTQKLTAGAGVSYPVTLTGGAGVGVEKFTTEAGTVECASSYHATLAAASTTLTATPTYTSCKAFGFLSATVVNDGCAYLFHLTTKTGADSYQAHADVVDCEAGEGKGFTITASTCKATVAAQTELTTVDIVNMTNTPTSVNDITLQPTVTGIKYTVTQDGFACPFNGTGAKTGGTYTSTEPITVTAEESGKTTPVEIHVG